MPHPPLHPRRVPRNPALIAGALLFLASLPSTSAAQPSPSPHDTLTRAILAELVSINTAPSGGEMSRATRAMAQRLLSVGYPAADVELAGPDSAHLNLVAHLRGRDRQAPPILLLAHIDVVEALRADWTMEPYELTERDGYLYGRGTTDNKGGAAVLIANMIRWKQEGFVPARDVIVILTTDEELTGRLGMVWLLANRPALARADFALNTDAGGFLARDGRPVAFYAQLSEKLYQTFTLEVTNRGGHSSVPREENAIYSLATALGRLERHRFPVSTNDVTRLSFARSAELEEGERAADMRAVAAGVTSGPAIDRLSRDPQVNGNLRTTCVATMLAAGHAENALPQRATATVNCRILPGERWEAIRDTLQRVVDDTSVRMTPIQESIPSPASPLRADVMDAVERAAGSVWPGVTPVPIMENGATDGLFLRNAGVPVYGLAGPLFDVSDDRSHGQDERVSVNHLAEVREFWYRVVRDLAGTSPPPADPSTSPAPLPDPPSR